MLKDIYQGGELTAMAKALYREEREIKRLDGWFIAKEAERDAEEKYSDVEPEVKKAMLMREVIGALPLSVSDNAIFVGTQRDAFARSYALINPSFKVEGFSGYCDPAAVYNDIEPNGEFTKERIEKMREYTKSTPMVKDLAVAYGKAEKHTKEVIYFVEQVTGHVIPDFRAALRYGIDALIEMAKAKDGEFYRATAISLENVKLLIDRYSKILREQKASASGASLLRLERMESNLAAIRGGAATNLEQAIQLYILLWQVMCLEQAPNPYAFSVGNADRIFEPYVGDLTRDEAAELFKHFLVFFNVGDRSWAISQNVIVGGRDADGRDLTTRCSYALLDAYYDMNLPQPILSVKLHKNTPDELYRELGRFFFGAGVLTPSLFNDDALFEVLRSNGVDESDLADYSVAGCQEPLIMGKDNGNTTNSWLNLPKVLEMVLTGGDSMISGEKLIKSKATELATVREGFYSLLEQVIDDMCERANEASVALSNLKVPFLSTFMGGLEYGADMRDTKAQGTKYNGSGCLVHGLSVMADSFVAIDRYLKDYPNDELHLVEALKANFEGHEELQRYLLACPKFGNHEESTDNEAREIAKRVSAMIKARKNYLGNSYRPDFSTPSTHLLYGYWVGATPNGRKSREMLGYGVDPLYGSASSGLGFRMLSTFELPFEEFSGGYASHLGIDPKYFKGATDGDKGIEFKNNVISPLFFNEYNSGISPFYLYVNVTTPDTLRKVLANPKKYAPSGVYIMRIHGTFVNFLDLSPAIQNDIIKRLDPMSTALC